MINCQGSEFSVESKSSGVAQETHPDFLRGYISVLHSSEYIPGGAQMSKDSGKQFVAGLLKHRGRSDPDRFQS